MLLELQTTDKGKNLSWFKNSRTPPTPREFDLHWLKFWLIAF